jgi:hypothetical protein
MFIFIFINLCPSTPGLREVTLVFFKDSVLLKVIGLPQNFLLFQGKQRATPTEAFPTPYVSCFLSSLSAFCLCAISVFRSHLQIRSNYTDLLRPGGALLTAIAQLSKSDEQSVKVKTDESGSYSMDTTAEAKGYFPAKKL